MQSVINGALSYCAYSPATCQLSVISTSVFITHPIPLTVNITEHSRRIICKRRRFSREVTPPVFLIIYLTVVGRPVYILQESVVFSYWSFLANGTETGNPIMYAATDTVHNNGEEVHKGLTHSRSTRMILWMNGYFFTKSELFPTSVDSGWMSLVTSLRYGCNNASRLALTEWWGFVRTNGYQQRKRTKSRRTSGFYKCHRQHCKHLQEA